MDVYGDLDSIQDVQIAWNTLQAIWQKVFPEWPVAVIGQRVIMNMKNFSHCGHEAKEVMVRFSNRFLTSNSQECGQKEEAAVLRAGLEPGWLRLHGAGIQQGAAGDQGHQGDWGWPDSGGPGRGSGRRLQGGPKGGPSLQWGLQGG